MDLPRWLSSKESKVWLTKCVPDITPFSNTLENIIGLNKDHGQEDKEGYIAELSDHKSQKYYKIW